jgi:hypothetical protein
MCPQNVKPTQHHPAYTLNSLVSETNRIVRTDHIGNFLAEVASVATAAAAAVAAVAAGSKL